MANKLASFMNGSLLVIRIGKVQLAYCQSLSFNSNMNLTPVGGIGAYSNHALEPVQFSAGGTMRVIRWTTDDYGTTQPSKSAPDNMPVNTLGDDFTSGNGGLDRKHFDPIRLLLSSTFDIEVFSRQDGEDNAATNKVYTLTDCRLTNYSFSFQPGSLLFEDISFVCAQISDDEAE